MATLTGPLHSFTARGQLAKTIIYETLNGRTYAKGYKVPRNDRTPSEVGIRSMVYFLTKLWKSLSTIEQASWLPMALEQNYKPFNAYFTVNMQRWAANLPPLASLDYLPTAAYAPTLAMTATGGVGQVTIDIDSTIDAVTWTERTPAGTSNQNWQAAAADADGSNLLAGTYNGRLYSSKDSGVTWAEQQPASDVNGKWYAMASDATGTRLLASRADGRLYTSNAGPAAAIAIFRSPAAINAPDRRLSRVIAAPDGAGNLTFVDTGQVGGKAGPAGGLPAGVYHYLAVPLSLDGRMGTPTADASATVT